MRILFAGIAFCPGFEYKQLGKFRDLSAVPGPESAFSGIRVQRDSCDSLFHVAHTIVSSLYLYPGQTLARTSSGFYVQQSGN